MLKWMWLAAVLTPGAANAGMVLEAYGGDAEEIFANRQNPELLALLTPAQRTRAKSLEAQGFETQLQQTGALGLTLLGYNDTRYPEMLRHIDSPPPLLYVQGDTGLLNGRLTLGMVGTRRPSSYGIEVVKTLGKGVAAAGAVVVSGLAAGLDSEAHKAALGANGATVACIAFGHDICYPAANRALMEVIGRRGAVVGEYPPGTRIERPFFLQRNRLIAALSHGLIIAEARQRSGTMNTLGFAAEFGRDVFAVPGSIFSDLSAGTNAMLREGAYLATSAEDILAVYGIRPQDEDAPETPAPRMEIPLRMQQAAEQNRLARLSEAAQKTPPAQTSLEDAAKAAARGAQGLPEDAAPALKALYTALSAQPQSLEALCAKTATAPSVAMAALCQLELAGLAVQLAGRQFTIKQ